jgi:hypothetical protein
MLFNFFRKNKASSKEETEKTNSNATEILIRYSYEFIEDIPQSERTPCNDFCKRLMDLNKLYSRSDIEEMSMIMGYSVWDRRGSCIDKGNLNDKGEPIDYFYIDKDGVEHPHCRHEWKVNMVKKKK